MIAVGDYVTIGKSDLTWEVMEVWTDDGAVMLRSGLTGYHRIEALSEIHFHSKGHTA